MTHNKKLSSADIPEEFFIQVKKQLEDFPEGISEYDLIQCLKVQGYFEFLSSPATPHELFQAHFILFHTLYSLRNEFRKNNHYLLKIETLKISLIPDSQLDNELGGLALQEDDKLMSYYLDLNNLKATTEDDVYDLLASFWNRFNRLDNRDAALQELGLTDPVDDITIKETYRRLVMQNHPDRGGDKRKLQKINESIKCLLG